MKDDPRAAWRAIRILEKGSFAHHKPPSELYFRDPDTNIVGTTTHQNIKTVAKHFGRVYNRKDAPPDFSILNDIPQREFGQSLATQPSEDKAHQAINQMKNNKAPGESGIPAEALKALPPTAFDILYELLTQFWQGTRHHFTEWQTALLQVLYKGKGDPRNPTNYRGIVLQDIFARLLSIILSKRLTILLKKCGIAAPSMPSTACALPFNSDANTNMTPMPFLWI